MVEANLPRLSSIESVAQSGAAPGVPATSAVRSASTTAYKTMKHTNATPAGIPRGRAKTTRRQRRSRKRQISFFTYIFARLMLPMFGPVSAQNRMVIMRNALRQAEAAVDGKNCGLPMGLEDFSVDDPPLRNPILDLVSVQPMPERVGQIAYMNYTRIKERLSNG